MATIPLLPPSITHYLSQIPEIPATELSSDQQTCPICLEPFITIALNTSTNSITAAKSSSNETPLRLRCGHVFGSECLHEWVRCYPSSVPISSRSSILASSTSSSAASSSSSISASSVRGVDVRAEVRGVRERTEVKAEVRGVNVKAKAKIVTHRPTCPLCRIAIKPSGSIERWELFVMLTLLQQQPEPDQPYLSSPSSLSSSTRHQRITPPPLPPHDYSHPYVPQQQQQRNSNEKESSVIIPPIHLLFTVIRHIATYHRRHKLPPSDVLLQGAETVGRRMAGLVGVFASSSFSNSDSKGLMMMMMMTDDVKVNEILGEVVLPWDINGPSVEEILEMEVGGEKGERFERAFVMLEGLERNRRLGR